MTDSRVKAKSIYYVEYHDLEDIVRETWGHDWSAIANIHNCHNDSSYDFTADPEGYDDLETMEDELIEYLEEGSGSCYDILPLLVVKGIIPKGEYIVNVCW